MDDLSTKKCSTCCAVKHLADYYKHKTSKGGIQARCKKCVDERNSNYARRNAEKTRDYASAYRAANTERLKESYALWKKQNAEKIKLANIAYKKANRAANNAQVAAWKKANPLKVKAGHLAYRVANLEKLKAKSVAAANGLADSYVANRLRVPLADLTPELLELKRMHLTIKRGITAINKSLKEKKD